MRYCFKILFIIFITLYSKSVFAQNSLELEYETQTLELKSINSNLDSLNNILQKKANIIETRKK